ncbi:tetratricopeptide repeat protein, partial [Candidatus Uhrbacteria bacterium]|nr:tetratricopeptide repeat protein [Candidatus Uhrbacteria bacterium]
YDLGRIYARLNKPAAALKSFAKAVKIEPNNPKYLDQLLEMSIITRDKETAEDVLGRLEAVNPGNQKLTEFRQRIEELEK